MKLFCLDIEATKTAELTGFNRNTINRYYKLFRESIALFQTQEMQKIIGVVEVDESYFGPKRQPKHEGKLKRGRGTSKQPVFGIYERGGRVYTEVIPDTQKHTLQAIIRGKVDIESIINSDTWGGYNGLVDYGFKKHFRVNHAKGYKQHGCHINGIESFWSFAKRRLQKFNGVKANFELHLKECEWRFGKSHEQLLKELKKLFKIFLEKLVVGRALLFERSLGIIHIGGCELSPIPSLTAFSSYPLYARDELQIRS